MRFQYRLTLHLAGSRRHCRSVFGGVAIEQHEISVEIGPFARRQLDVHGIDHRPNLELIQHQTTAPNFTKTVSFFEARENGFRGLERVSRDGCIKVNM